MQNGTDKVMNSDLRLLACASSRDYAETIAAAIGIELTAVEERSFEDGEFKVRPLENVAGADAFVVQSLYAEASASAADKWLRCLFLAGAARDAGAEQVTLVIPYFAFCRKDRRTQPFDPLHTRYLAQMAEAVGASAVITLDIHNLAAFQNAFRCRAEAVTAAPLFVEHIRAQRADSPWLVLSPDAGGVKRAEAFRQRLSETSGSEVALGMMEKFRGGGELRLGRLVGDVADRHVLIIDDLIASGSTLAHAAKACKEAGARRVTAFATHGLFVKNAGSVLADPALDELVITDSVRPHRVEELKDKLTVLESGPLIGRIIGRMHEHQGIEKFHGA
ncbi:MAG: ribose-phosphate pyrophosphokinase [Wenzhouxiangellaceae bacterium]|nr:ribose-phosphate pyrophosphokinase [Wenzhouxiangellaceae bacterium]